MHPVGSSWPSTDFCGIFHCRAKLVPKKAGHDSVPELQENRTREDKVRKSTETAQLARRDDSEFRETGINSFFSRHCEDDGFDEINEACNVLVKEAEDPEIKSDIKRLVELYKASKELTKTLEETEIEKDVGPTENVDFGNLELNMHDEIEDTTANNFEQIKPLKDYYLSPEMANKNFEAIYKEYNEYLKKYYAFYPEYRNELDRLLTDENDIQNNCIRSCDDDAEASASENDVCEICALESQDNFDYQPLEIETRIQTKVKPKQPQTYPGYFYDEETNSYVYYYGPNQPYVDVRFGSEDELTPEEGKSPEEFEEHDDEAYSNDNDEEVEEEEDIYYFPITPELEKYVSEDDDLRIFEENNVHTSNKQDIIETKPVEIVQTPPKENHSHDHNKLHKVDNDNEIKVDQGDMSVSYYKYDSALEKYVLKVPKDEEEYEKFRQEYIKVYNLSDSNSNEQFEDMNAYQEYFRANFAENVNDTEINKTDSYGSESTRKLIMLDNNRENVNTNYLSGSSQNFNIPTFEYKMLQANQDGHNVKQETCPHGNQILPIQENFYQSGQNCQQKQESCYQQGHEAHGQTNWNQEVPKDVSKQDECENCGNSKLRDDLTDLLKPSLEVQTPTLNRFERLNEFLKSRTTDDVDLLRSTIRLPKLRKPRPLTPIFVPSLRRNRRSAKPDVKSTNDDVHGEEWETFITVEGLVRIFIYKRMKSLFTNNVKYVHLC